jgi:molybdate transport system regulatory protein
MQFCHNERLEIKSKVWIECRGRPLFGQGRKELLLKVEAHGSISQAARELEISYRRAWSYIKFMEERLGIKLVTRQAGGSQGGGAALTAEARDFIEKYEDLTSGINELVDKKFQKIFPRDDNPG